MVNEAKPLASDCRYREDIVAWMLNDFDLAQSKKVQNNLFGLGET
jgi:hypothetical protein